LNRQGWCSFIARTIAGSAPRRRQALLRTIERAASIASIRVRPVLAPAPASMRQYSLKTARRLERGVEFAAGTAFGDF
jgi:hypothetical protein